MPLLRLTAVALACILASCGKNDPAPPQREEEANKPSPPTAILTGREHPRPPMQPVSADLKQLVVAAFDEADAGKSEIAFSELLDQLTPENAAQLRELIAEMKPTGDQTQKIRASGMRRQFDYFWASIDGPGAIGYGFDHWAGERLAVFMREVLPGWANGDPESAIAWAEGPGSAAIDEVNRNKLDRDSFERFAHSAAEVFPHYVVRGLINHDIDTAADYASRFADDGQAHIAELFTPIAARALEQRGATATLAWAEGFEDQKVRRGALIGLASAQSPNAPDAVAEWFTPYVHEPWATSTVRQIMKHWSQSDPAAASSWKEKVETP